MKRGGPLRRYTPLKSTGQLKRSPLARVNRKRKAERHAAQFGAQAELCRSLPCCACGSAGPSDPHHEPTRARGGLDADTVPLCRRCHDLRHDRGRVELERRHGVDLMAIAAELASRF